ncbi:hypothetical protein BOX15_Mlig021950g1, partial [Macrostomum lignano]
EAWLPFCLACIALALGNYAYRNGALDFITVARQFRRRDWLLYLLQRLRRQVSTCWPIRSCKRSSTDSSNQSKRCDYQSEKATQRWKRTRRLSDAAINYSVIKSTASEATKLQSNLLSSFGLSSLAELLPCLKQLKPSQISQLGKAAVSSTVAKGQQLLCQPTYGVIFIDSGLIEVQLLNDKDVIEYIPPGEIVFSALMLLKWIYACQAPGGSHSRYLRLAAVTDTKIRWLPFDALLEALAYDREFDNNILVIQCWRQFTRVTARGLAPLLLPDEAPVPWLNNDNAVSINNNNNHNHKTVAELLGVDEINSCACTTVNCGSDQIKFDNNYGHALSTTVSNVDVVVQAGSGQVGELICVLRGNLWQRVNGQTMLVGRPGDLVGQLEFLSRLPLASGGSIYCLSNCTAQLVRINLPLAAATDKTLIPTVANHLAKQFLHSLLSRPDVPLTVLLEPIARYVSLRIGQALPLESVDNCYFYVVSGRLQDFLKFPYDEASSASASPVTKECYSAGCLVNTTKASLYASSSSLATVVAAVRDSELIRLSRRLVDCLSVRCPAFSHRLVSAVAHRLLDSYRVTAADDASTLPLSDRHCIIALLPGQASIPVDLFAQQLAACLPGVVRRLSSDRARSVFGASVKCLNQSYPLSSTSADEILKHWIAAEEDSVARQDEASSKRLFLLLSLDYAPTAWTRAALRRSDRVLVLLEHNGCSVQPSLAEIYYSSLSSSCVLSSRRRMELILLHSTRRRVVPAGSTLPYLVARPWLSGHRHLRLPLRLRRIRDRGRVDEKSPPPAAADMCRLARHLSNGAIGLALGGGGARGAAHPAVLRLLANRGVPVDAVAGTSIGALVGALWSMETCPQSVQQTVKQMFADSSKKSSQAYDVTLPLVSLFRGGLLNSLLAQCFDVRRGIEDLWLPCYFITTELRSRKIRVLSRGSLWKAVRASMSYPVLLPPVWSDDGQDCLVDGCFVNNLPVDVLRQKSDGVIKVIAVDISDSNRLEPGRFRVYGDCLSGFSALLSPAGRYPRLIDVQMRLASITSNMRVTEQRLRSMHWCWYLTPPVQGFGIASFSQFQPVYDAAVDYLEDKWRRDSADGSLPTWLIDAAKR